MGQRTPRIMGVYRITNTVDGKFYLGSSNNIHSRWGYHRSSLRRGVHKSESLQAAWNEHGEAAFEFAIVETVDTLEEVWPCEDRHLREHRPFDPAIGYNRARSPQGAGWRYTDEQRERLAASLRGKPKTAEHRANIWATREVTPEFRAQMAANGRRGRGVPKTAEHNRKNAEAQRGALNHNAKLDADKVIAIRRRIAAGERLSRIAKDFGVQPALVGRIKSKKAWAHVPDEPVTP